MHPTNFEVRVKGVVPTEELGEFTGMEKKVHRGCTVLRGALPGQPALVGLVDLVEDLGFRVIGLRRLDPPAPLLP